MRLSEGDASVTRVAIVNRGEAAVRRIRAERELNLEHGFAMRTMPLHTEAERRAMLVVDRLRPEVIAALRRGMRRTLERC